MHLTPADPATLIPGTEGVLRVLVRGRHHAVAGRFLRATNILSTTIPAVHITHATHRHRWTLEPIPNQVVPTSFPGFGIFLVDADR